jgi:hypothetical protein
MGGIFLTLRHSYILIVLLVVVALAVSGCSGGSNTTATPTPTQGATGTPAPASETLTAGSIFDTSNLHYYEWRIVSVADGKTTTENFRVEKGTETYNGAATNFKKMTMTETGGDPAMLTVYYDAAGTAIGGKSQDSEIPAEALPGMSMLFNALDIGQIWGAANYPLSNALPETLSINGKNYVCKKWSVGNFAGNAAVWTATVNNVQMAVQVQYGDNKGDSWTYQLWDWG